LIVNDTFPGHPRWSGDRWGIKVMKQSQRFGRGTFG
jgi:hypothetical protein